MRDFAKSSVFSESFFRQLNFRESVCVCVCVCVHVDNASFCSVLGNELLTTKLVLSS